MKCNYCSGPAPLKYHGQDGYPYSYDYGPVYVCTPCQAWVGVHQGTTKPLGRLANAELRHWKIMAHAAFDPLWMAKATRDRTSRSKARKAGYAWLAEQMGKKRHSTHIGYFNVEECREVVEICSRVRRKGNGEHTTVVTGTAGRVRAEAGQAAATGEACRAAREVGIGSQAGQG